jgi:hypothetical protein
MGNKAGERDGTTHGELFRSEMIVTLIPIKNTPASFDDFPLFYRP